ncbi:MAG: SRPBCC family protein [Pseudomonadota bacterium]
MQEIICNTVEMACTPEQLYAYVTQPWLWHEWHPNSQSAQAEVSVLCVGDEFSESIVLQPLLPLPLTLRRATRYQVLDAVPAKFWRVSGKMRDGWLQIHYEFEPSAIGTRFTRTLTFSATGLSALMMPLLRRRMRAMSVVALNNLTQRAAELQ